MTVPTWIGSKMELSVKNAYNQECRFIQYIISSYSQTRFIAFLSVPFLFELELYRLAGFDPATLYFLVYSQSKLNI